MYKYFYVDELTCQHCNAEGMDKEFMQKIEKLREEADFPFIVTSAYRCTEHPLEAVKSTVGAHTTGRAIDIAVRGRQAHRLLKLAMKAGFTGIGVQQKGNSRFLHLDDMTEGNRPWVHGAISMKRFIVITALLLVSAWLDRKERELLNGS